MQPSPRNTFDAEQGGDAARPAAVAVDDVSRCGTTIGNGTYTIESVIGRGGMGTVFGGVHNWTGRSVAIKVLRREVTDHLDVARVLQEARTATSVAHPNVVEVLDMGRDRDGPVYLVFERLVGETLADRLDRDEALTAMETAELLLPVLDALATAHRLGIVHRDLKPENIFLESDGNGGVRAKLLDFGLAKLESATAYQTQTGIISGTPAYMSPERAMGKQDTGPPSDVWSMGVVLYECLTNRLPFDAAHTMGVLLAVVNDPVPSLHNRENIAPAVADVVAAALCRDLPKRLPDAGALRDAFAAAVGIKFSPLSFGNVTRLSRRSIPPLSTALSRRETVSNIFATLTVILPLEDRRRFFATAIGVFVVVMLLGFLVASRREPVHANASDTPTTSPTRAAIVPTPAPAPETTTVPVVAPTRGTVPTPTPLGVTRTRRPETEARAPIPPPPPAPSPREAQRGANDAPILD